MARTSSPPEFGPLWPEPAASGGRGRAVAFKWAAASCHRGEGQSTIAYSVARPRRRSPTITTTPASTPASRYRRASFSRHPAICAMSWIRTGWPSRWASAPSLRATARSA
ncbi:hypothetical protein [Streptomyces sp. NBC_01207]|uniref:hypothetical protein n=1 Tax=Streptomyces sp. NBC_01207 TaxID=2903772 RepID=UPI002E133C18|nr:hypothetical protein OG457_27165 [Streptomyces sp. NBC_01207]